MKKRFPILITDRFDLDALALLKGDPELDVTVANDSPPTVQDLSAVRGMIIRSRTRISTELLMSAPHLEVIVTATSGFDHVDLRATAERKIAVMYTPDANAASACELTWALVFACARRVLEAHRATKAGDWRREALIGTELRGKTYGIIGLGRIGQRVATVAQALGMKVIAFDPYRDEFPAQVARVALDELLKLSDVVSLHVPATEETRGMLSAVALESMNRNALLVNTSRGSAIFEKDLVQALTEKWIGAAGLDVFEREPLARDSKLMSLANVVLTPHLGATTREAFAAASRDAAEKIRNFVKSGTISDPLPPKEAWFHSEFRVRSKSD